MNTAVIQRLSCVLLLGATFAAAAAFANDEENVNPSCKLEPEANCSWLELRKLKAPGIDLHESAFMAVRFDGANLEGVNFLDADLERANFKGANVKRVIWIAAKLSGATWVDGRVCAAGSVGECLAPPTLTFLKARGAG